MSAENSVAHTPGPWTVQDAPRGNDILIIGRNGPIARVDGDYLDIDYRLTSLGNAALIAAAPRMEEALLRVIELAETPFVRLQAIAGVARNALDGQP